MPRIIYAPKTRAAILAAAKGKKLKEAHEAAKKAGYKGGMQSLYVMLRNSGVTRRKRRKSVAAPAPVVLVNGSGLVEIQGAIEAAVQARVKATIEGVIEKLRRLNH